MPLLVIVYDPLYFQEQELLGKKWGFGELLFQIPHIYL